MYGPGLLSNVPSEKWPIDQPELKVLIKGMLKSEELKSRM